MPKDTTQPEARERFWCEHFTDDQIERAIRYAQKRVGFSHWRGKDSVLRAVREAVIGIALDFDASVRERSEGETHYDGRPAGSPRLRVVRKDGAA